MTISDIQRMLAPVRTRIANLVSRAVVNIADDSQNLQLLQLGVLADETRSDVERFQQYGLTSVPKAGAEAVVIFVGGRRDHGLAIAVDDRRYRISNLESGEVAVYDATGSTIVFRANGNIELTPSSGIVALTGDLNVSGTVTGSVDVIGGGKSLKTHTHTAHGTLTNPAGDVTGITGAPS